MNKKTTTKKTGVRKLQGWAKKLREDVREEGENYRQQAERLGVPSDKVKELKYWMRENQ